MKQNIKIAILGGTGKIGSYLVKQLTNQGFEIKMLVRNPDKLTNLNPLPEIIHGNAKDLAAIRELLEGCQAVINTMGHTKGEEPVFSTVTSYIIQVMKEYNIRRYIVVAGLGVDVPGDKKDFKTKLQTKIIHWLFPKIVADHQKEFDLLVKSDIDWTLIRLPFVKLVPSIGELKVKTDNCPGKNVSATDLTNFMIRQVSDLTYNEKAPFVSN